MGGDPGSGWEVCGESNATKDHTLVRKSSVTAGNAGNWDVSAGTNADDCEWIVLDQNDWSNLGFHDMDEPEPADYLALGEVTDSSLEVLYSSSADIGGFQFQVGGVNILGASGGAAADAGFVVSIGGDMVLGFSFSGAVIPAGSGVLTNLSIQLVEDFSEACLYGIVISCLLYTSPSPRD